MLPSYSSALNTHGGILGADALGVDNLARVALVVAAAPNSRGAATTKSSISPNARETGRTLDQKKRHGREKIREINAEGMARVNLLRGLN